MKFTDEQLAAIERRSSDLLLEAGAGSGKTSVLVERFVRVVREDGVSVGRILAITFTEKAAGELRERIRARLRELGEETAARECEGAWISTIHGFCARVLRAHALVAGLDPAFAVLEPAEAAELAGLAFDAALAEAARTTAGSELIASHGVGPLRAGILAAFGELRSRGQREPSLPVIDADPQALGVAAERALAAAAGASLELGALPDPGVRVSQALDVLARAPDVLAGSELWPGDIDAVVLRNGATALSSDACEEYRAAVRELRAAAAARLAAPARDALDALLGSFSARYGELKRARSAVDFEDLELLARDLLARPEIGARYRERFGHVMVDEMQDTNGVQLSLVDLVSGGSPLFMVGDAQQSIYGFRHADVELFAARAAELEAVGGRASLRTNFRTRAEIVEVINDGFATAMGEEFRPLLPGRIEPPAAEPLVELLVVDKGANWEDDGLAAPWRVAEARALAGRVQALVDGGAARPGEIVVLTRATTDLRAYERALEDRGVPTYVIGGRGYWEHPQVVDAVSYLRSLANPRDEEAWYGTLFSPLCGLSLDGLVLVAAGARDELESADAARLDGFEAWFAQERLASARIGVEELLERAMERTGYDRFVLALPGGRRRLANVRKLIRLGREWETAHGLDLRGFLDLVVRRAVGTGGGDSRESEAPVESEGLDAVRLMTIHRAKGLEFPVVCVADLGRGPIFRPPLLRIGRDGRRLGLRIGRPGTAAKLPALDYDELGREHQAVEDAEVRRLFYVAMTRARDRLVLSGAAKLESGWKPGGAGTTPIDWIGPAFGEVPGVAVTFVTDDLESKYGRGDHISTPSEGEPVLWDVPELPGVTEASRVSSLSYSALALHERCGYRFYVERVIGLPPVPVTGTSVGLGGAERGRLVHAALQSIDLRRPVLPAGLPAEAAELVDAFLASSTCDRLAGAAELRRESPFAFTLDDQLVTGTFDAFARTGDRALIVDYKTDRLQGVDPETLAAGAYEVQRLIYALAALRAGATHVEVVHLFLEAPDRPAVAVFKAADTERLEVNLRERAASLLTGHYEVTATPHRAVCAGCPAAGGLCSWPLEMTMRLAPDRLF